MVLMKYILYRVSQEECARLRESVPWVKLYRYNPKHLYPKFNGYGDIGQRKVWTSLVSAYYTLSVTWPTWPSPRQSCSSLQLTATSLGSEQVFGAYSGWKSADNYDTCASVSVVLFNGFMSQVTLMKSTDINITETTYSCQFQYEFGNQ